MRIRNAENKDIPRILALLSQVLELHARIFPDIFISGTTKYTESELRGLLTDESRRVYVAVDETDGVLGYAFCEIKDFSDLNNIVPHTELYVDDLCVDSSARGQHIGSRLFDFVKKEAKELGCNKVTLNVWEGNDSAKRFYEKMGMKTKESQLELIL